MPFPAQPGSEKGIYSFYSILYNNGNLVHDKKRSIMNCKFEMSGN